MVNSQDIRDGKPMSHIRYQDGMVNISLMAHRFTTTHLGLNFSLQMKSDLKINPKILKCALPQKKWITRTFSSKSILNCINLVIWAIKQKKGNQLLFVTCLCFFYFVTLTFLFQQKRGTPSFCATNFGSIQLFADVKTSNPGRECHHFR